MNYQQSHIGISKATTSQSNYGISSSNHRFALLYLSISITIVAVLFCFFLQSAMAGSLPVPKMTVNGSDGSVSISSNDNVSLAISLDSGNQISQAVDWWIAVYSTAGWQSLTVKNGQLNWENGIKRSIKNKLINFSSYQVPLPNFSKGKNTFYFAIDNNADNIPDGTWWDSAEIIYQSSSPASSTGLTYDLSCSCETVEDNQSIYIVRSKVQNTTDNTITFWVNLEGDNDSKPVSKSNINLFSNSSTVYSAIRAYKVFNSPYDKATIHFSQGHNDLYTPCVEVKDAPPTIISSPETPAVGENVSFSVDIFGNDDPYQYSDPYYYDWDFGDGNSSTDESPSHVFSSPGEYSVEVAVNLIGSIWLYDEAVITVKGGSGDSGGIVKAQIMDTDITPDEVDAITIGIELDCYVYAPGGIDDISSVEFEGTWPDDTYGWELQYQGMDGIYALYSTEIGTIPADSYVYFIPIVFTVTDINGNTDIVKNNSLTVHCPNWPGPCLD